MSADVKKCAWLVLLVLSCASVSAAEWRPERNVELIAGTAPGSSQDRNARRIHKIWQDNRFFSIPVIVVNKPGGGGEIGWTYLAQFAGDGHHVSMTSPSMLSNQLLGKSKFTLADVTPLALLTREYETFSVRVDHPISSMAELAERLKKDPGAVTFGFGVTLGNAQHTTGALYGKALGIEPRKMKMVVFNASAEAMTSVMGGHVDVLITTASTIYPHVRGGKLRVLGVAAPQRLEDVFAAVPTFKESGVDIVFSNWNGVVGARNMTPVQIAFWDSIFAKTTATAEWKKAAADLQQDATHLGSREMKIYMEREREQYRAILGELGLLK